MSLRNMEISLRVKMLWHAMHSNSLWATHFRAKYMGKSHLREVHFKNMNGFARRSWLKAKQIILQYKKVIIGDGNSTSFWNDNWIGEKCLSEFVADSSIPNPYITVKEFFSHPPTEDLDLLHLFTPPLHKTAIEKTKLIQDSDIPV